MTKPNLKQETVTHQVLIPVYNGEEHISQTLDCILSQDTDGLQVIVSDNASTDRTPEILSLYQSDLRVRLVRNETNIGMFGNWDLLLTLVNAETYTLISHDDLLSGPDVLSKALKLLHDEKNCPAVYSDVSYINKEGKAVGHRKFGRKGIFDAKHWIRRSILSCRNQLGQPIVVRTESSKSVRFDQRVRYAGDLDFAGRLALTGDKPIHIPEPLFVYRMHSASGTKILQKHALQDMRIIALKTGISLTTTDRIRQRAAFYLNTLARTVILNALALQARFTEN